MAKVFIPEIMTEAEIKALREAATYIKVVSGRPEMLVSCGRILSLLDALAASEARLEKAREALKPFADVWALFPECTWIKDDRPIWYLAISPAGFSQRDKWKCNAGHFKQAATTLKEITDT